VEPQGKIVTNSNVTRCGLKGAKCSKIRLQSGLHRRPCWGSLHCCHTLPLLQLFFSVATTHGKVSLRLWKSLETRGTVLSYFVATL